MNCRVPKNHLVIIGGGSAAFSAAIRSHELGARVTMVNDGLPIGGCCVNVGCVPSKTLIRAAGVHYHANANRFKGIQAQSRIVDFSKIIKQKAELVSKMRQTKYLEAVAGLERFRLVNGHGRLSGPREVEVNGEIIKADRILIATGTTTKIPRISGLAATNYLTHESAFELKECPETMIILGGRYIALECAQLFSRLGTKVTVLQRSNRILPMEMPDLTDELTTYFREEGIEVVTGVSVVEVGKIEGCVKVEAKVAGVSRGFQASHLLVATGRRPNSRQMGLEEQGVYLDSRGFIRVDANLRTSVPGIYAAGDILGGHQLVYTAAYEGRMVADHCFSNSKRATDYTALPWVIFTDPQVAGVGLDERQAAHQGIEAQTTVLPMSYVPRAIAARDTRGFVKLIRNKATDRLVGARILAPEGSELLMEVTLAIKHGITAQTLADTFHPYLTMGEAVKLAAVSFRKDVQKLSCCGT